MLASACLLVPCLDLNIGHPCLRLQAIGIVASNGGSIRDYEGALLLRACLLALLLRMLHAEVSLLCMLRPKLHVHGEGDNSWRALLHACTVRA